MLIRSLSRYPEDLITGVADALTFFRGFIDEFPELEFQRLLVIYDYHRNPVTELFVITKTEDGRYFKTVYSEDLSSDWDSGGYNDPKEITQSDYEYYLKTDSVLASYDCSTNIYLT